MKLLSVKRIDVVIKPVGPAEATMLWWMTGIDPRRVIAKATATIEWEFKIGGIWISGEAKGSREQRVR